MRAPLQNHTKLKKTKRSHLTKRLREHKDPTRTFALVIDGSTLSVLFRENMDEEFRSICMQCDAVLCCRMSPAQKAQVKSKKLK